MTENEKSDFVNLLNRMNAILNKRLQDAVKLIQDDFKTEANIFLASLKEEPKQE